jgi:hypothetical protein
MGRLLRVRSQGGVFTTAYRRGPEVALWVRCRQMPSQPKVLRQPLACLNRRRPTTRL